MRDCAKASAHWPDQAVTSVDMEITQSDQATTYKTETTLRRRRADVRYGAYQLRSTVGLLYQDPNTLCYESTYQIYDMTNTGIVPCLDQVHVYIDAGYFTTTLGTTTETSSTMIISWMPEKPEKS